MGVVGMFMRQEDGVDIRQAALNPREALGDLPVAQARIHEHRGPVRFNQRAVAGTAAAEYCYLNPHASTLHDAAPVSSAHSPFT